MFLKHMKQLNAKSFYGIVHYLEAVWERQHMRYFTACWDVAVVQRRQAAILSACDELKLDFLMVEWELALVLDILAQRLTLPRKLETAANTQYLMASCNDDRRSIQWADDALAVLKAGANSILADN
jgi:hypothetical protein